MIVISDYHMHTKYSGDCSNEVEDVVKQAIQVGLKEIAITDHGPSHNGYGIKKSEFPNLRKEIDRLKEKYPQINILLGIEANIIGTNGEIDVDDDMRKQLDWVNAGYHFGSNLPKDIGIHALNFLCKIFPPLKAKARKMNTEAMVNAINNHSINMITHPGAKGPIDIDAVAKAAADRGTILEINNSHGHLTVEELKVAMKYPVQFAVCSDAHVLKKIGQVDQALDRAFIAGIDKSRINNVK